MRRPGHCGVVAAVHRHGRDVRRPLWSTRRSRSTSVVTVAWGWSRSNGRDGRQARGGEPGAGAGRSGRPGRHAVVRGLPERPGAGRRRLGRVHPADAAITEWVAPEQGCAYCHADGEDLARHALHQGGRAPDAADDPAPQHRLAAPCRRDRRHLLHLPSRQQRARRTSGSRIRGRKRLGGMAGNHAGQNTPGRSPWHTLRCPTIRSRRSSSRTTTSAWSRRRALPEGNRQVDQADGMDLRPDDAHFPGPGRELHLLPQQPRRSRPGTRARRRAPPPGTASGWCVTEHGLSRPAAVDLSRTTGWARSATRPRPTAPPATRACPSRSTASAC